MQQGNRIGWAIFLTVCWGCATALQLAITAAFLPIVILTAPIILFSFVGVMDAWGKALGKRPV